MKSFNLNKIKNRSIIYYFIITIVSLIICIPLFQKGIHTGHDGDFHIARTIGTIEQILNGESPYIISRFSNNLGYGWNLFYPPITTFLNVIFGLITNNVVIAMKIFIFLTFFLSGISMYKLVKTIFKSNIAALFASIFYMLAPYHLLNSYTRLAVGEMAGLIFIPVIFNGVYSILNGDTKKSYLFILGSIGLILSHNISTLLVFLLGLTYIIIHIKKLRDINIFKTFVISTIIIILSVLFFIIPLLEQIISYEYEMYRYGKMYSTLSVAGHALNPLQLLIPYHDGADSSMCFILGIPILIGVLLTFFIKNKNNNYKKEYSFFLIMGIICTIMSTLLFPWKFMPDILLMIQFPWRMLLIVTFCFSIIAGVNFSRIFNLLKNKTHKDYNNLIKSITYSIIIVFSCIYSLSFFKNLNYEFKNNTYYQQEEIIDPINQVSRYSAYLEYWPQKSIQSIDYVINRDNNIIILSGNAKIENQEKKNGILTFNISNVENNTYLELPYLIYKGYKVSYTPYNTSTIQELPIEESEHGLIQIKLDSNILRKYNSNLSCNSFTQNLYNNIFYYYYNLYIIFNYLSKNKSKQ